MSKNIENLDWLTLKQVKQRRKTIASHYDSYTEYIEDYRQMQQTRENNRRIRKDLKMIDIIIREMEEVQQELERRGLEAELRYAKGRMRIVYGDRILFRNIKFN